MKKYPICRSGSLKLSEKSLKIEYKIRNKPETIPGLKIISPADCLETVKALESGIKSKDPVYIRLTGSSNNPIIYKNDYIILVFTNNTKVQLRKNKNKNDINKLYALFNQIELNEIEHYKHVDLTINKQIIVIENEELVINENEIEL